MMNAEGRRRELSRLAFDSDAMQLILARLSVADLMQCAVACKAMYEVAKVRLAAACIGATMTPNPAHFIARATTLEAHDLRFQSAALVDCLFAALDRLTAVHVVARLCTESQVTHIVHACARLTALTRLELVDANMSTVGAGALAAALPLLSATLHHVNVSGAFLGDVGLRTVRAALCSLSHLTALDLSNNRLTTLAMPALGTLARDLSSLQTLNLAHNKLVAHAVLRAVSAALTTHPSAPPALRRLELGYNADVTMVPMPGVLAHLTALQALGCTQRLNMQLPCPDLSSLSQLSQLTMLALCGGDVESMHSELCALLLALPVLRHLDLGFRVESGYVPSCVCHALGQLQELTTLRLGSEEVTTWPRSNASDRAYLRAGVLAALALLSGLRTLHLTWASWRLLGLPSLEMVTSLTCAVGCGGVWLSARDPPVNQTLSPLTRLVEVSVLVRGRDPNEIDRMIRDLGSTGGITSLQLESTRSVSLAAGAAMLHAAANGLWRLSSLRSLWITGFLLSNAICTYLENGLRALTALTAFGLGFVPSLVELVDLNVACISTAFERLAPKLQVLRLDAPLPGHGSPRLKQFAHRLSHLAALSSLQLRIRASHIEGPPVRCAEDEFTVAFRGFKRMRGLQVANCSVAAVAAALPQMRQLTGLELEQAQLDPALDCDLGTALSRAPWLASFKLHCASSMGSWHERGLLCGLSALTGLTELSMAHARFNGWDMLLLCSSLVCLTQLQVLSLRSSLCTSLGPSCVKVLADSVRQCTRLVSFEAPQGMTPPPGYMEGMPSWCTAWSWGTQPQRR